jgi:hypothetical protein
MSISGSPEFGFNASVASPYRCAGLLVSASYPLLALRLSAGGRIHFDARQLGGRRRGDPSLS